MKTNLAMSTGLRLRAFLPYRLSVLANRVSSLIADTYTCQFSLRTPEWRVIAVIGETPELTATEVAERTAMDKVAVTRAVKSLVEKGKLRRKASQTDGRLTHLVLTASGRKVYQEVAPAALQLEDAILGALSSTERRQLDKILVKLSARVDALDAS